MLLNEERSVHSVRKRCVLYVNSPHLQVFGTDQHISHATTQYIVL